MPKMRTFMSPVCSRSPAFGAKPALTSLRPLEFKGKELCWLDELLDGGLEIPESTWNQEAGSPAFVLLIAGPPGSGKTTFAAEMCHNLAVHPQPYGGCTWKSLYVSAETSSVRIIENATSFGWDKEAFCVYEGVLKPSCCTVFGAEVLGRTSVNGTRLGKLRDNFDRPDFEGFFESLVKTWLTDIGEDVRNVLGETNTKQLPEATPPDVVVIDSLNVFQPELGTSGVPLGNAFHKLRTWIAKGQKSPRLLVIIVDGYLSSAESNSWEFLADAAFRFEAREESVGLEGYYLRTFQVVKIKTQKHAWGKQILKLYPGPQKSATFARPNTPPYLKSGGIFVFPSVHWHLSRADHDERDKDQTNELSLEWSYSSGLDELDSIIGSGRNAGFPPMQTTALVGRRGGMKSHLAYYFMMLHALGMAKNDPDPKCVLLVSLRDDLTAAKQTLSELLVQQDISSDDNAATLVQTLIDGDRLEIFHNPPGCISPGELCHCIFVALARTRNTSEVTLPGGKVLGNPKRSTAEIVILDGLDHLESKFPLCAGEKVLIPALITLFRSSRVCSVVISADEGVGSRLANLGPIASLILNFSDISKSEDRPFTTNESRKLCRVPKGTVQEAGVEAIRVPAGQIGGKWGILGRDAKGKMRFFTAERAEPADDVLTPHNSNVSSIRQAGQ